MKKENNKEWTGGTGRVLEQEAAKEKLSFTAKYISFFNMDGSTCAADVV